LVATIKLFGKIDETVMSDADGRFRRRCAAFD